MLLSGGDKSPPQQDIKTAIELARNLEHRHDKATTRTKTVPYDVAEQLPPRMAISMLDEASDDISGIARAMSGIACAHGMSQVARDTDLSRESLYKALSENGNPSFATKVARTLGVRLHAEAA